jgi:hypothetical protein
MIKQVGSRYEWEYRDCIPEDEGWFKVSKYRPFPFDMTVVKVKRQGKLIDSIYPAWWTGDSWEGRKLKKEDQVVLWKLQTWGV